MLLLLWLLLFINLIFYVFINTTHNSHKAFLAPQKATIFPFLAALSLADNPPLGAPLGPPILIKNINKIQTKLLLLYSNLPLFPPNPPAFPCLAAATSTLTGLPLKSCPCFSKAFLTASESAKSTCPNPLDYNNKNR